MAKVAVVTDTISCMEPTRIKEYGIRVVPVNFNINGKFYRDGLDLNQRDFWKIFPDIKTFATAAPAPSEYIRVFTELSRTTDSIACAFVSKSLSATLESAIQARETFLKDNPNIKIEIIDSRTAVGAEGFVVLEMARAAESGKNLADVVRVGQDMVSRVKVVCALETLKMLIRIGRAPKTAYMGELFQVKPIIGLVNNTGVVENLGRARGMEKAIQKLVELIARYIDPQKPAHFHVHFSNSIEDGERLKNLVTDAFKPDELYFTPFSPMICGAAGPVVAVAFYS